MPGFEGDDFSHVAWMLAPSSVLVILQILGLILAIIWRKRCPGAATMLLVAMLLLILAHGSWIVHQLLFQFAIRGDDFEWVEALQRMFSPLGIIRFVLEVVAYVLLIGAVFVGRGSGAMRTGDSSMQSRITPNSDSSSEYGTAKPIAKGTYLALLVVPFVLEWLLALIGAVVLVVAINDRNDALTAIAIVVLGCSVLLSLVAAVTMFVLIYKIWAAIQDGNARTTPGKAVGFLFIPFFNIYWYFQAFWGWTVDYNKYVARHGITNAPRMSEGFALALNVLMLTMIIPYLNILISIAVVVMLIMFLNSAMNGVNALATTSRATSTA